MQHFARTALYMSVASVLACVPSADADSALPKLGTVTVEGHQKNTLESPASGAEQGATISGHALDILGGAGQTNPYAAISFLPSVMAQNPDPYGLANVPGGNKGVRIRGERNPHGGIGTVEGLPLSAVNPGPGEQFLFDMENIRSVTLLAPPFSPDKLAVFTTQGYLNSNVLWPRAKFGGEVDQSFGSYNFHRSFIRLDSGTLPTGTRVFISGSYTHADQWRGPGASPDYRYNGEIGISQDLGRTLSAKVYAAYGSMKENNYLPLTYTQASNLGQYYNLGYNGALTGNAVNDVNYYGYNRQKFQDYAVFGELNWHPDDQNTLVIKPFYSQENGYYLQGMGNLGGKPGIRDWIIDHSLYGVVAQYDTQWHGNHFSVGYWFENLTPPGPPSDFKIYRPVNGQLVFGGYGLLARATADHVFNSPYFQWRRSVGPVTFTAGARYLMEQTPSFSVYNTAGIPDASYANALNLATSINPARSVEGRTFYQWLPYFSAVYAVNPDLDAVFAYGRNNGAPAFSSWPSVQMNIAAFQKAGVTAQRAWDQLAPETSDSFSLGLKWHEAAWYVNPTFFYATYRNKYVNAYDPLVGISYDQNAGVGRAWGFELAAGAKLWHRLSVFSNLAYDRAYFTQDLRTGSGTFLPVTGLQFPDTPRFIGSLGALYEYGRFSIAPTLQYMGSRYADTLHTQPLPGYLLANLNMGYHRRITHVGELTVNLSILNLFNRHYIGLIDSSYLSTAASGGASFYPGAPITVAGTIGLRF